MLKTVLGKIWNFLNFGNICQPRLAVQSTLLCSGGDEGAQWWLLEFIWTPQLKFSELRSC